jgi:hypothetical protein
VVAAPGAVGEILARIGRPRIGIAIGGTAALAVVVVLGLLLTLCGLGDGVSESCERKLAAAVPVATVGGLVTTALLAATLWRSDHVLLRRILWSAPLVMLVVVAGAANTILS